MDFLYAFTLREFKRIFRHKGFLLLVCGFPLLLGLMFGRVYSARVVSGLPFAVLDQDHSQLSRLIIRNIDATRGLDLRMHLDSEEEMKQLLLNGEIAAGLIIPRHLERDLKRGLVATVSAYVDASNLSFANQANSDLRSVIGTISTGIQLRYLKKMGSSSKRALALAQSLTIEIARIHNPGFNYQNYVVPGIWAAVLFQLLVVFGALGFVREFELGRGPELWALAEQKVWKLLFGKITPYILIGTVIFSSYFFGIFPFFGIPIQGSTLAAIGFSSLLVLASLSYGLALSSKGTDTVATLKSVLVVTGPAFTLSGYIWPAQATPTVLVWLAQIFPLTPYLSGFRKLLQEGAPLSSLRMEAGHLLLLSALGLWAAYRGLKKQKELPL